eukprot:5976438-Amphidinium_carterae.1
MCSSEAPLQGSKKGGAHAGLGYIGMQVTNVKRCELGNTTSCGCHVYVLEQLLARQPQLQCKPTVEQAPDFPSDLRGSKDQPS